MSEVSAPSGEVTLMFTDIEGSTKGWDTYRETFQSALDVHNRLMRQAIAAHNGFEVKTIGDSFMVAFGDPLSAALCALDMQRAIESEPFEPIGGMRIRIGLHSGRLEPYGGDYFGPTVNHTARIESAGHGGQVVMSEAAACLIDSALPDGTQLHDNGLHRLKDLGAPIRLFLLSACDLPQREYPPLRTLDPLTHNFPAQVTSFVGRERETDELIELLHKKTRLITLIGPGGTGKTRLSMQVAAEVVQDYPDGIWLVELANLTDVREVPTAVALALKVPLAPEKSIPEQVFAHLKTKRCLLVFDNFEHVIEGATFVANLLKQCRDIFCLVTSQHLLQIAGETEYALTPLSVPPPDAGLEAAFRYPSIQLFVERAQAARPQFLLTEDVLPAVVELCRRLDGSPLALELTAALLRGMTPAQILPRLKDRFKLLASTRRDLDTRQRSLRGALDWSYELLNEDERQLFAEISVFSGGFCLEDLEAISSVPDPLFLAFALRDKSLLKTEEAHDETRYFMLETIRLYAAEKLEESGHASDLRTRHGQRYLEIAQKLSAELNSSGEAIRYMTAEIDNMRAGMDSAVDREESDTITAYARALARFFIARGLYEEGDRRLTLAEGVCRLIADQESLAELLLQRGRLAELKGSLNEASQFYRESHSIFVKLNNKARIVPPLSNLGNIAWLLSDLETARYRWEEALQLARDSQQPDVEAILLTNLSTLARDQGSFDEALEYLAQSITIHTNRKAQNGMAFALWHYAETLCCQKQFSEALAKLEESHRLFEEIGFQYGIVGTAIETGQTLFESGQVERARKYAEEGLASAKALGDRRCEMIAHITLARLAGETGDLIAVRQRLCQSAIIAKELGDKKFLTHIVRYYGEALVKSGQVTDAYPLLAAAEQDYKARGLYDAVAVREQALRLKDMLAHDHPELLERQVPTAESLISQFLANE